MAYQLEILFWKGLFVTNQCRGIVPNFRYCCNGNLRTKHKVVYVRTEVQHSSLRAPSRSIPHSRHRFPCLDAVHIQTIDRYQDQGSSFWQQFTARNKIPQPFPITLHLVSNFVYRMKTNRMKTNTHLFSNPISALMWGMKQRD